MCIRAYFLLFVYSFVLFRVRVFIRWREFGDERASVCVFLRTCVRVCVRVSFRAGVRAYVHLCLRACVREFECTRVRVYVREWVCAYERASVGV